MTRIDKVMSVLDEEDVKPDDREKFKAYIIANACPHVICWKLCTDINARIRCWKEESE